MIRLLAALVVLLSLDARADDEGIARAHYATGLAYYQSGSYGLAVAEFKQALRLSSRPPLLYNIARAYDHLGDAGRAVLFYERFVAVAPDAPEVRTVADFVARLRASVATVSIEALSPVTEILLDGQTLEVSPTQPFPVTAGHRQITVRSAGMLDGKQDVALAAGEVRVVRFELADVDHLRARARRARWLWPVVGASAVVVAGVAITLGLTLGRTNYANEARDGCPTTSCLVVDGAHGLR